MFWSQIALDLGKMAPLEVWFLFCRVGIYLGYPGSSLMCAFHIYKTWPGSLEAHFWPHTGHEWAVTKALCPTEVSHLSVENVSPVSPLG